MNRYLSEKLKPDGNKSAVKKTVALSVASMFNSVLSLVMSMVLARVLSKTDLAAYQQTNMVLTTVFPFLQLGIPSGIYYLLTRNQGRERAVVNEAFFCVTAGTCIFSLVLFLGGNRFLARIFHNSQIEVYVLYVIPICLFMLISSVASTAMVYTDRISFSARFHIITNLIRMTLMILSMLILRTVSGTLAANAVLQMIFALLSLYLIYEYMLPSDNSRMKVDSVSELLRVSVPLGTAAMVVTVNSFLDKWIVSILCSPEEYAVFVSGAHEVPFITAVTNSIMTVIIVSLTEAFRDREYDKAIGIIRGVAEKTSMILMPIMLVCAVLSVPLVRFIFTDRYLGAVPIFLVYLLYMPYWTIYYGPIMTAMGKPNAVLYCSLAGLSCNAVLSVVLVKVCGPIGASIATIVTIYMVNLPLNLGVICRKLKVNWTKLIPVRHYLRCILFALPGAVLSGIAAYIIRHTNAFFQLAVGGLVFVLVTGPIYIRLFRLPWRAMYQSVVRKFQIK